MPDVPERCPMCGAERVRTGLPHGTYECGTRVTQHAGSLVGFECLERQMVAARAEAERWKQQYEALRAGVESVAQELRKLAFSCAQDSWETGHPYHDGASDAYYEAGLMVRQLLAEAGGGSQ